MVIRVAARTDRGQHRERNEDHHFVDVNRGIFIVCDGLGGHMAGNVAARKAIEFAVEYLDSQWALIQSRSEYPGPADDGDLVRVVEDTIRNTCTRLLQFGKTYPHFEGMATTMTLLLLIGDTGVVGHVGDSRIYLKHNGAAKQLTSDHTLYNEFSRANPDWCLQNRDLHALKRFQSVLTRCLGRESQVSAETVRFRTHAGDILLLCTDGMSDYFPDEKTIADMLNGENVETLAENLMRFAYESGGCDNATAIVVQVGCPACPERRLTDTQVLTEDHSSR